MTRVEAEAAIRRRAVGLALTGSVPFAIAAVLPLRADGSVEPAVPCPFAALTGAPCPLCGSTRAFVHLVHGDPGFLQYNAVTVALAALALVLGVAGLLAVRLAPGRLPAALAAPAPRWAVLSLGLVLVAAAWAWTLAHRATILS